MANQDITFKIILVKVKDYCNEITFFNKFYRNITYTISPPPKVEVTLQFTYADDDSITVTIPKGEQYKLATGVDLKFVFSLYWTNT